MLTLEGKDYIRLNVMLVEKFPQPLFDPLGSFCHGRSIFRYAVQVLCSTQEKLISSDGGGCIEGIIQSIYTEDLRFRLVVED